MSKQMRVLLACLMLGIVTLSTVSVVVRAAYAAEEECKEENKDDCKK